jgi:membrane protein DedA with SNARE-associated domain
VRNPRRVRGGCSPGFRPALAGAQRLWASWHLGRKQSRGTAMPDAGVERIELLMERRAHGITLIFVGRFRSLVRSVAPRAAVGAEREKATQR